MKTDFNQLLNEIEIHVTELYNESTKALQYHNLDHAKDVVTAARKMADHYKLDAEESFIVLTAAWMHDTGYLTDSIGHEALGAARAEAFLERRDVKKSVKQAVMGCILATSKDVEPTTKLESILKDADLYHMAGSNFIKLSKLLRQEFKANGNCIGKEEWRRQTIQFMKSHNYYTDFCRERLESGKRANISQLMGIVENNGTATADGKAGRKNKKQGRGVETMFRVASANSQQLSNQADAKANILITVNSIIISVILGMMVRSIESASHLVVPIGMLLGMNLLTIAFAILATKPRIPRGVTTQIDIVEKKANLLFFGNFYKMRFDEYANGVQHLMNDQQYLYFSLTKDIYHQGVALGRKYRLLRYAYNIFLFGLVASVLAFIFFSTKSR
jgi:predicted metal-dependent HD superfamily phosphohydrolase